jgi:GNAT superfamily N-acetyltransferase
LIDSVARSMQAEMDRNMAAFWAPYGRAAGAEGGDAWFYTGLATPLFNGVLNPSLDDAGLGALVGDMAARIARRGAPALWWLGPRARPADIAAKLQARGLSPAGAVPGMTVELDALPAPDGIPGFEIRRAASPVERALWGRIAAAGTGFSPEAIAGLERLEPTLGAEAGFEQSRYVGYLEAEPVASAALVTGDGIAGIYAVATLPPARRKGIGRAMTLQPLLQARSAGCRTGILQYALLLQR